MMNDQLVCDVRKKVESVLNEEGVDLVEFKLFNRDGTYTVRCDVDYPCGGIDIDACGRMNRRIFSLLERENILGEDYSVEVNSPGLDRVMKTPKDFKRTKGKKLSLWFFEPLEGKESMDVFVEDVDDQGMVVKYKSSVIKIGFNRIKAGKERIDC